ncbi:MAG: hypothetical protein R3B82_23185 [Sandaracinaceae bacterium]
MKALEASDPATYRARMVALREAAAALLDRVVAKDASGTVTAADAQGRAMGALGESAGAPIVTDALARVAAIAREHGGGAKPSGAGGGDVALGFFGRAEDAAAFRAACTEAGLTPLSLSLGAEGVRAEES